MKTSVISKSLLLMALLFISNIFISAGSPRQYMYDTKEENGKIVSKVVFLNNNGLLDKELKFVFTYNNDGKVADKTAYRWNKEKNDWTPFYLITYSYDNPSGEIHSVYSMWNKKKKDFTLNVQNMIAPASSYNEIFS